MKSFLGKWFKKKINRSFICKLVTSRVTMDSVIKTGCLAKKKLFLYIKKLCCTSKNFMIFSSKNHCYSERNVLFLDVLFEYTKLKKKNTRKCENLCIIKKNNDITNQKPWYNFLLFFQSIFSQTKQIRPIIIRSLFWFSDVFVKGFLGAGERKKRTMTGYMVILLNNIV